MSRLDQAQEVIDLADRLGLQGDTVDGIIGYAEPHHPEHQSYRESEVDVIVVQLNAGTKAKI